MENVSEYVRSEERMAMATEIVNKLNDMEKSSDLVSFKDVKKVVLESGNKYNQN